MKPRAVPGRRAAVKAGVPKFLCPNSCRSRAFEKPASMKRRILAGNVLVHRIFPSTPGCLLRRNDYELASLLAIASAR
ncbi:Glycoprotein hormones alpha chain [Trichinella spiralis]|uniref:Glycoprotein hormones alpha chain n=1 Tax=Trichinella spiralis TaxID=6334 RepID=A0ABR3K6P4_TRISP